MLKPGDVVLAKFVGATGMKPRPTVVISTDLYQSTRPDVIVAELTTQVASATAPTDYVLQDWSAAGLHFPSAFRLYLNTLQIGTPMVIGHLSNRDWQEVQARLRLGLAVT
ncbi:MAG: type II toxin-antitoxin system PemK/MazF family toxin [Planctomycetes bacterium]|nr:type II toxin-antitoxin system PemK/MazF family toxin [Planctomycetota bacterium]